MINNLTHGPKYRIVRHDNGFHCQERILGLFWMTTVGTNTTTYSEDECYGWIYLKVQKDSTPKIFKVFDKFGDRIHEDISKK